MKWHQQAVSPEEVIAQIRPGMRLFLGTGAAEPRTFVAALMAATDHNIEDLELIQLVSFNPAITPKELRAQRYRLKTFFSGWAATDSATAGRIDLIPSRFSRIPQLFEKERISVDVAIVEISPPDATGYCSLGIAHDVARLSMQQASFTVGEINTRMPRTYGDTFVHISDFDMLIRSEHPPYYVDRWPGDAVFDRIAANVSAMVNDKSCLSFSIGPLFDALGRHLAARRHLGIHSPYITDAVMDLMVTGAVSNRFKGVFQGKTLVSYALGTPKLMRWLDRNPMVEFQSIGTVFHPQVIGQNDRVTTIVPARKVDLTGRVVLQQAKGQIGASPAEVLDFLRGAEISPDGQTIFALPSRNHRQESNIRISVERFANQFSLREFIDRVVTEYGVAHLSGRTVRERAQALIEIAHPQDRAQLIAAAKEKHLIYADQIFLADSAHLYPAHIKATAILKKGLEVRFRPIKPSDEEQMRRLFYRFSDEAVYSRYFSSIRAMPHIRMQEYVNFDWNQGMSIVGLVGRPGQGRIIAEARFIRELKRPYAEVAFIVDEAYQNHGISTFLYRYLVKLAKERGVQGFSAEVLFSNIGMMKVFRKGDLPVRAHLENGVYQLTIAF
jgi:acyl-CoA hydrolase/GNAT superfamily N-acetyltransferase